MPKTARRINLDALQGKVFGKVKYTPHTGQRKIHRSRARHRVAACGRRFGKSFIGGNELTCEAVKTRLLLPRLEETGKRREFWIVGPNYTDAEKEFRVAYNALSALGAPFDKPGTYNNPHDGDMQISLYGGKFLILAKSAQYPERLVGEGLNGVIMAEAAKQRERTWTKYIRPMLADFNGWSLHTSTPEGRNWFYHLWMRGQSSQHPDWESWRMPSWRNPVVYPKGATEQGIRGLREMLRMGEAMSPGLIESLKLDPEVGALVADLSTETFNQEIAAKFTEFAGRVFKEFDEETHVRDFQYNPAWPIYAACDYGFTNPFVWLLIQVDPFGTVWVLDEMYETGLTIDEAAREITSRGLNPGSLRVFYPDPASPGDTRALEKALRLRGMKGTGGELNKRLRLIRAALKVRNLHLEDGHPDRQPKLFINRKCTNVIREMNIYRYPKTVAETKDRNNLPENPLKKDDHTPETLGRFMAGYFNLPERSEGARVREAAYSA